MILNEFPQAFTYYDLILFYLEGSGWGDCNLPLKAWWMKLVKVIFSNLIIDEWTLWVTSTRVLQLSTQNHFLLVYKNLLFGMALSSFLCYILRMQCSYIGKLCFATQSDLNLCMNLIHSWGLSYVEEPRYKFPRSWHQICHTSRDIQVPVIKHLRDYGWIFPIKKEKNYKPSKNVKHNIKKKCA
jgi:hypothetical protein